MAGTLSEVLQRTINEASAHSHVICKKCLKICGDYQAAVNRLNSVKENIISIYNNTLTKLNLNRTDGESSDSHTETGDVGLFDVGFDVHSETDANVIVEETTEEAEVQGKNIVVVKTEPLVTKNVFTMNDMNSISDGCIEDDGPEAEQHQEQAYQTVILEEVDEGEYVAQDSQDPIIITDSVIGSGEYFEGNETQMIEISTEGHDKDEEDYETFEFDDDMHSMDSEEATENDEETTSVHSGKRKRDHSDAMRIKSEANDQLSVISGYKIKSERLDGEEVHQTPIFMREGMSFKCQLCDPSNNVVYDTKTISIHMKTDHYERIYVCDICGADFRKRNLYNDHMDEHTSEWKDGEYQCAICQCVFHNSRQFRSHKKTHNVNMKIWSCKECNKNYSSKNLLDEHMNMHTGERPYKCPHCTKDFASKYTLTAHMKTHYERKRPYECKECNKSFFSNQNLTQHERTHSGIKEYVCEICNKVCVGGLWGIMTLATLYF